MICPKCYAKIKPEQIKCHNCGFDLRLMQDATNKAAKKAKRSVYKDDVLYTTQTPPDVKRKKLILLSIFLGLFGAHHFYVGKIWQGLYMLFSTVIGLSLSSVILAYGIIDANNVIYQIYQFALVFQGLAVIFWVVDMVKIFLRRYKIPVYRDEFSK